MIDENAIGVHLALYDLESIEYSLSEAAFLEYLAKFVGIVEQRLREQPLSEELRRVDMGHATYLEFADGDQLADPITWVRSTRQALIDADLPNVCVLTAGGRWVNAHRASPMQGDESSPEVGQAPESGSWRVSNLPHGGSNPVASPLPLAPETLQTVDAAYGPSEPMRKALAAEAFAQPTTSGDADSGWGPGLYVEKDAIEQLGKNLRNTPTALPVLSSVFYRIGA